MIAKDKLEAKHKKYDKLLKETGDKVFEGKSAMVVCYAVGAKLGVTGQTVYNYYLGDGRKDGFLKEAILEEFQKL